AAGALVLVAGIFGFVSGGQEKSSASNTVQLLETMTTDVRGNISKFNNIVAQTEVLAYKSERLNNALRDQNFLPSVTSVLQDAVRDVNEQAESALSLPLLPARSGTNSRSDGVAVTEIRNDLMMPPEAKPETVVDPWSATSTGLNFLSGLVTMPYIDGQ